MDITRILNLPNLLHEKSFFLLGPRATGKSRLIRNTLPGARVFDLLDSTVFDRLARRSKLLEEESSEQDLIVIDEVQKLPGILDEVHRLIEKRNQRFLLTGSSARKLKRGGANLLAGRARQANLFPLTWHEIASFKLDSFLAVGGLPGIHLSRSPWEDLKAYAGTYLREEIQSEAVVRRFDAFVRFLDIAATKSGEEINYESIASDCGVSGRTIRGYFEVLEDTRVGFLLPPFSQTVRRKAVTRSKFYLFDLGVTNVLLDHRTVYKNSPTYGNRFEQFIALELRAYLSYRRRDEKLMFWRSQSGFEVDFVVGTELAIEVKSTALVQERDLKGIRALQDEKLIRHHYVVSQDPSPRVVNGITVLPWEEFLKQLWDDKLLPLAGTN
jgi:predicted AAA+ superfamily ATPase